MMNDKKIKYLEWNLNDLKNALDLDEEDVKKYFTDGRRVSFLTERKIAKERDGILSPSEGAGYDLILPDGKWEVRSLTKGVYFCPSKMVGSGRSFEEEGFLKKLDEIEGYFICDVWQFPKVPYISISSYTIREYYFSGKLGKTSKLTRKKFFNLFGEL
tara:strand:- start:188 stop:661 length:474 start_codon:yes stop_codon:yes gene_type:complete